MVESRDWLSFLSSSRPTCRISIVINMIYHITVKEVLETIRTSGVYRPHSFDKDGFIHCSRKDQVIEVANRYYSGQKDLVLLEINDTLFNSTIVYENLEGGSELFPHVYSPIPISAIVKVAFLAHVGKEFAFPHAWFPIEEFR